MNDDLTVFDEGISRAMNLSREGRIHIRSVKFRWSPETDMPAIEAAIEEIVPKLNKWNPTKDCLVSVIKFLGWSYEPFNSDSWVTEMWTEVYREEAEKLLTQRGFTPGESTMAAYKSIRVSIETCV